MSLPAGQLLYNAGGRIRTSVTQAPVVNVGVPITSLGLLSVSSETQPSELFANNEQGLWYDPLLPTNHVDRRNLLTYSEDLSNVVWNKLASTVGSNVASSPINTQTADAVIEDGTSAGHYVTTSFSFVAGSVYTASAYLKALPLATGATRYAQLVYTTAAFGTTLLVSVDLATGQVLANSALVTGSAVYDNGFWRVSATATATTTATGALQIRLSTAHNLFAPTYQGDSVSGFYVWGAQLESAPLMSTYQKVTDWTTEYIAQVGSANIMMWQDSAGTIPVTGVEQPVGKLNDRSGKGNHATQATAASRPVFSALKNMYLATEQFNNVYWTKQGAVVTADSVVAPNGTITADVVENTPSVDSYLFNSVPLVASATYTRSVYALPISGTGILAIEWEIVTGTTWKYSLFDTINGVVLYNDPGVSASMVKGPNNWWRCSSTITGAIWAAAFNIGAYGPTPTLTKFALWGAQLEPSSAATSYQRVNTAIDYDYVGFPSYLRFDGVDDGLVTANIAYTTDKVTVWAGVYKASDAASGTIVESSIASGSNSNVYALQAPPSDLTGYFWRSRGAGGLDGTIDLTGPAAPVRNTITCVGDVANDVSTIRVDGVPTTVATDQGTGNWATFPLYIGRRGGTSLPFNGRLYNLIVRAALSTAAQISDIEKIINSETGQVSTGVAVSYAGGLPYNSAGALIGVIGGTVFNAQGAFSFTKEGRVVLDQVNPIAFYNAGLPFTAQGGLAIAAPE
jgi:hypothetical protein